MIAEQKRNQIKVLQSCVILFITLIGCKDLSLDPKGYVKWVENTSNGLKIEKTIDNYKFSLQYKPLDYVVAMEEKTDEIKSDILIKRKKKIGGMEYYSLRISYADGQNKDILVAGVTSEDDYLQRTSYYSGDFQDDISLAVGKDTIACGLFNNVRNYGLAPYLDFVLGFDNSGFSKDNDQDRVFILNDKVFGCGILKFKISQNDLRNIPSIKTI